LVVLLDERRDALVRVARKVSVLCGVHDSTARQEVPYDERVEDARLPVLPGDDDGDLGIEPSLRPLGGQETGGMSLPGPERRAQTGGKLGELALLVLERFRGRDARLRCPDELLHALRSLSGQHVGTSRSALSGGSLACRVHSWGEKWP